LSYGRSPVEVSIRETDIVLLLPLEPRRKEVL
jgi:hypothetical protein